MEGWVGENGINGFRDGMEQRRGCCAVRKVEPFRRAIAGRGAWVTGIRRGQSASRALAAPIEWDAEYGLHKVSPLLDWSEKEIWDYIRKKRLPYNSLHDHRFSQHRLRALHARGAAGRGCARRALVVGAHRLARVRTAPAAPDSRARAERRRVVAASAPTRTHRLNYFPVFFDLKGKRCWSSAAARWRCAK